jgi:DNA repair protein RadC
VGRTARQAESLGRFVHEVKEEVQLTSPAEAGTYLARAVFSPFEDFLQEELWVLLLTTKNKVTHQALIYRGVVDGTQVRLAEFFRPAVRANAPVVIAGHCHPSGDPTPSAEDVQLTRQLVEAGKLLDIELLDHIIVGSGGRYTSLRDRGVLLG